jgi:pre-rRNA-processing protein TSR4
MLTEEQVWLDNKTVPSGSLGKCKVCSETMSLLLQLNGDLPDRFPGHERRIYVLGCRRKPCRRKEGSVRTFRAVRTNKIEATQKQETTASNGSGSTAPIPDLGSALFGAKPILPAPSNPFSSSQTPSSANPFSCAKAGAEQPIPEAKHISASALTQTFADKARISSEPAPASQTSSTAPPAPWTEDRNPYPSYHLDADKEYLYPEPQDQAVPSNIRVDNEGESSGAADDKAAFESAMDKTFQRFADRLSQNPEQVLRYEFGGEPLIYSKTDAVGKKLAPASNAKVQTVGSRTGSLKIPSCEGCGSARVFELQLTPRAIAELEAEEMGVDGLDWGTVVVGVCGEDCQEKGKGVDEVGYLEEWVGVQWEEVANHKKR